jgi:hypothetical protein
MSPLMQVRRALLVDAVTLGVAELGLLAGEQHLAALLDAAALLADLVDRTQVAVVDVAIAVVVEPGRTFRRPARSAPLHTILPPA